MLRSVLKQFQVLAIQIGFTIIIIIIIYYKFRLSRYSLFYTCDKDGYLYQEQQRQHNATRFLEELRNRLNRSSFLFDKPEARQYCIAILSTPRKEHSYIAQSVAFILDRVNRSKYENRLRLFILSTGYDSVLNDPKESIPNLVRVIQSDDYFRKDSQKFTNDIRNELKTLKNKSWEHKEMSNYLQILRLSQDNFIGSCKYTLILQDDSIASKDFLTKIEAAIIRANLDEKRDWFAIKLFYPEYWSGWEYTVVDVATIAWSAVLVGFIVLRLNLKWLPGRSRRLLSFQIRFFLVLYWAIITVIVVKSIGKQNLITPFSNGLYPAKLGAVLVAQLYPRRVIASLTEYLSKYLLDNDSVDKTIQPIDVVIDDYVKSKHLHYLLLVPNPFQHIGMFSSNLLKNQGNCYSIKVSSTFPEADLTL